MKVTAVTLKAAIRNQELAAGDAEAAANLTQAQFESILQRLVKRPDSATTRANVDNLLEIGAKTILELSCEAEHDHELAKKLKGWNGKAADYRNARLSCMRGQMTRAAVACSLDRRPTPKAHKQNKVIVGYSIEWKPIEEAKADPVLEQFNDCVVEMRKAYKEGTLKDCNESAQALAKAIMAMVEERTPKAAKAAPKSDDTSIDECFEDDGASDDDSDEIEMVVNG